MSDAKQQLTEFLLHRAFEPVMRARADRYSDAEKRKLEHVQKATQAEIERYRHYGSAKEVVINFRRDLTSSAAKKVHAELRSLHLPTIQEIRDEFDEKVRELGVDRSA